MSKYIAERCYRVINEEGDLVVCYVVKGDKTAARMASEECKRFDGRLEVEVKKHHPSRSLNQNRLLWALLGKMAEAMSGHRRAVTAEECYCIMLEDAGVSFEDLWVVPEAEQMLRQQFRAVRKLATALIGGRRMNEYRVFVGSSKFDTAEMTALIEATLDRLAELGVYDSEIESARAEYGVREEERK